MGPLPKRKLSRRRKYNRRNHDKLALSHLVRCGHCNEYKRSHQVCQNCGYYGAEGELDGVQVIEVKEKES